MANEKISDLASGNPAQNTDLIPIARAGANFSITPGSIAALVPPPPTPSIIDTNWHKVSFNVQGVGSGSHVGDGMTVQASTNCSFGAGPSDMLPPFGSEPVAAYLGGGPSTELTESWVYETDTKGNSNTFGTLDGGPINLSILSRWETRTTITPRYMSAWTPNTRVPAGTIVTDGLTPLAISNIAETSDNIVTLTVSGSALIAGDYPVLSGLTTGTWLNGLTVRLVAPTNATTLTFVDSTLHGTQASHVETGFATAQHYFVQQTTSFSITGTTTPAWVTTLSGTTTEAGPGTAVWYSLGSIPSVLTTDTMLGVTDITNSGLSGAFQQVFSYMDPTMPTSPASAYNFVGFRYCPEPIAANGNVGDTHWMAYAGGSDLAPVGAFNTTTGNGTGAQSVGPLTPTALNSWAMYVTSDENVTPGAGWVSMGSGGVFSQQLSTLAPVTGTSTTLSGALSWAGILTVFETDGSPAALRQSMVISGAIGAPGTVSNTFGLAPLAGSTIFVVIQQNPNLAPFFYPSSNPSVTDSAGNIYRKVQASFPNPYAEADLFVASNVAAGALTVNVTTTSPIGSGEVVDALAFEVTHLAPISAKFAVDTGITPDNSVSHKFTIKQLSVNSFTYYIDNALVATIAINPVSQPHPFWSVLYRSNYMGATSGHLDVGGSFTTRYFPNKTYGLGALTWAAGVYCCVQAGTTNPAAQPSISNVVESPGSVVTMTVSGNTLTVGEHISFFGLSVATWLSYVGVTLIAPTNATTLTFIDPTGHGTQVSTHETGYASSMGLPYTGALTALTGTPYADGTSVWVPIGVSTNAIPGALCPSYVFWETTK